MKRIFQKTIDNELVVSQNGIEKFRVPVLVFILALCIFNFVTVIAMGVSLFFGVTYRFVGKDDLSQVNRAMSTVGGRATEWWESRNVSREVNDLCYKYDKMNMAAEAKKDETKDETKTETDEKPAEDPKDAPDEGDKEPETEEKTE